MSSTEQKITMANHHNFLLDRNRSPPQSVAHNWYFLSGGNVSAATSDLLFVRHF